MRARAVLMAVLMLGAIPAIPNLLVAPVVAEQVTHFGNSGFPASMNLTFNSSGSDSSINITLGANSVVGSAAFEVRGWADQQGISPSSIGIDVGDDGDLEWYFGGQGNGSFGHLNQLSNGWARVGLNLSSGYNSTYSLRLPLNASVTSASVNFSTLSELTLKGNDVEDTYLHNPNPSWGNATYKNCNYGNSSHILVGKTEWANWHIYRSLYWFNLSQLPAVTVLDANLSFWVYDVSNNANTGQPVTAQHTYDIRPLLKDWEEGSDYNVPVQNGAGATWNNAIDNLTGSDYAWTSAGASSATDRGAIVASVTDSPANLEQTWIDFNSQNLTNLVQSWVNGSVSNQGLLFVGDESTSKPDASMLKIISHENATYGPRLVVLFEGSSDVTAGFDVGDDGIWEWNHAGNLSNGSTIPDFSATLNSLLANASPTFTDAWGNEFVDIPLNVSGNATLILDEIDVRYDWSPSVGISPHGDLLSELNQHLANLTPDATGNVSIPINVSSGSAGVVQLLQLQIGLGERPPSIGSFVLPTETMVPNGLSHQIGVEVTSYQGLANLSWLALTPQLLDVANRPTLFYSAINSSSWVNDPGGYVANHSGNWQVLNSDTGQMDWGIEVGWAWPQQQDVVWKAQVWTTDSLNSERLSTLTTDHERRMEITSFHLWDETLPTDGGPEIFTDEWVAGGDQLSASGTVRFLNSSSHPLPGEVLVELANLSGNGTVDTSGVFSIQTNAPNESRYGGISIGASIEGVLDFTPVDTYVLTFRVDATTPGMMLHSPTGERLVPDNQQLFNVSIAETSSASGLDEGSLQLRWWVEALHDDGDGVAEADEYAARPLIRQGESDFYLATYEDLSNSQGQSVSLYITGYDRAGNPLLGGGPGIGSDLHHYISLVPSPTTLTNASLTIPSGEVIVPTQVVWLNLTMDEENWVEDLEQIVIDFGQGAELTWVQGAGFSSYDQNLMQVNTFTLESAGDEIYLNLSFSVTPLFDPVSGQGLIGVRVTDSSGVQNLDTGLYWEYNADIMLVDYTISIAEDPSLTPLQDDGYVAMNTRLLLNGRVRYVTADLAPPAYTYEVRLEVPLDLPLLVEADENGLFNGTMDAHGSGLYRVTILVGEGPGVVNPAPEPIRLQVDDQPPLLVGSEPAFIAANSTSLFLQFDIQEVGAGLPSEQIPTTCAVRRGLETVGEPVNGSATLQAGGEVSRHLVNLTFQPLQAGDSLDCWLAVSDMAGNQLSGIGSSQNWALSLTVVETRPEMLISDLILSPESPIIGQDTSVNLTLLNIGNHSSLPFFISLEAQILHDGLWESEEIGRQQVILREGETSTTLSFDWIPDWKGELDLVVNLDVEQAISERDENNTFRWTVSVQAEPQGSGFFISQAALANAGFAVLFFICIGILLALRQRGEEDDLEDWEEDEEESEPDTTLKGTVEPDGYEYLEWPAESEEWWYRENSQDAWSPWENAD